MVIEKPRQQEQQQRSHISPTPVVLIFNLVDTDMRIDTAALNKIFNTYYNTIVTLSR